VESSSGVKAADGVPPLQHRGDGAVANSTAVSQDLLRSQHKTLKTLDFTGEMRGMEVAVTGPTSILPLAGLTCRHPSRGGGKQGDICFQARAFWGSDDDAAPDLLTPRPSVR
jgi:hypothetical protein